MRSYSTHAQIKIYEAEVIKSCKYDACIFIQGKLADSQLYKLANTIFKYVISKRTSLFQPVMFHLKHALLYIPLMNIKSCGYITTNF